MSDHGVAHAWELAPACAEGGVTVTDLEAVSAQVPPDTLSEAVRWISETLVLRETTQIIAECCHRISDLVQAIKGYSHMDRATEYEADIHDGLENTLIILGHRLKGVGVIRDYDRSIPMMRMYGNSLNQVWTNILDNAIDATNGVGRIAIRTMTREDHVVVEFEDSGGGIPQDVLPRIFEPFFTLKPQGQGIGLGLDTAWRIVSGEYAGSIAATSEPGQTIIQVKLPLSSLPGKQGSATLAAT
jgi:signal transduction histidine kinase